MTDGLGESLIGICLDTKGFMIASRSGLESWMLPPDSRLVWDFCFGLVAKGEFPSRGEIATKFGMTPVYPDGETVESLVRRIRDRSIMHELRPLFEDSLRSISSGDPFAAIDRVAEITMIKSKYSKRGSKPLPYKGSFEDRIMAYHAMKSSGGLLGAASRWPTFNKTVKGWQDGIFYVIAAMTSVGKCVAGTERMINPVTGEIGTVKKAVKNKWPIRSTDEFGIASIENPKSWSTGMKRCFRVKTRNGFELTTSIDHKYRTPDGYLPLKELGVGSFVLRSVKRELGEVTNGSSSEGYVIGCLLGDGCLTRSTEITFTNIDSDVLYDLRLALEEIDCTLSQRKSQEETCGYVVKPASSIWSLLDLHGVVPSKSICKVVSGSILSDSNDLRKGVIEGLWDTDGYVEKQGDICIGVSSKELALFIIDLLMSFGIGSNLTLKKTKKMDSWIVRVLTPFNGLFGREFRILERKHKRIRQRYRSEFDKAPRTAELDELIKMCVSSLGQSICTLSRKFGRSDSFVSQAMCRGYYPKSFLRFLEGECSKKGLFGFNSSLDYVWDSVISIEDVGLVECFDFECPKNHNFECGTFIVHNSWSLMLIIDDLLKQNRKPMIVSMEMAPSRLQLRLDCIRYRIPFPMLRDATLTAEMEETWMRALYDDSLDTTSEVIFLGKNEVKTVQDVLMFAKEYGCTDVLIDGGYRLSKSREWKDQAQIVQDLQVATELSDIPWIVTTQLGDASETGKSFGASKLNRWNVRYAKEWLIDPDVVITLAQPEDLKLIKQMEVSFEKWRDGDGKPVSFRINWNPEEMNYDELTATEMAVTGVDKIESEFL